MFKVKTLALMLCLLLCLPLPRAALAEQPDAGWLDEIPAITDEAMYSIEDYAITQGLLDEWVNILLLGSDVRDTMDYGNTDSIVILSINLGTKRAKLTSISRDIWVEMDGRTKSGKLNTACKLGGPELTMQTLNEYFDLNLQYYALVNLSAMAEAIDQLGGLELDITLDERLALNKGLFNLSPLSGMKMLEEYGDAVHLNGNQAVAYARIRNIDSDFQRTQRQRNVLLQIARRLQQESAGTIVGVVMNLMEHVETNMDLTQLMTIAAAGMQINLDGVQQLRIPVDKTYEEGAYGGVWCVRINAEANRKLIQQFIYSTLPELTPEPAQ